MTGKDIHLVFICSPKVVEGKTGFEAAPGELVSREGSWSRNPGNRNIYGGRNSDLQRGRDGDRTEWKGQRVQRSGVSSSLAMGVVPHVSMVRGVPDVQKPLGAANQ